MENQNIEPVTFPEFMEMVRQMRHNQRRCLFNLTTEKIQTREYWEKQVDDVLSRYFDVQLKLFKNE